MQIHKHMSTNTNTQKKMNDNNNSNKIVAKIRLPFILCINKMESEHCNAPLIG